MLRQQSLKAIPSQDTLIQTKHKRHKHTPTYTHAHDLASPWGMNKSGIISERARQGERKRDRKRKEDRMGEGDLISLYCLC